jgi:hypothetical protein
MRGPELRYRTRHSHIAGSASPIVFGVVYPAERLMVAWHGCLCHNAAHSPPGQ